MTSNLHLVDGEGRPLASHIVEAVQKVEPRITDQFSRCCDPAELSNSLEEGARRIAQHEKTYGRLEDISGYTWRTLRNAAISLVRSRERERSLWPRFFPSWIPARSASNSDALLRRVQVRNVLENISERDRMICYLEHQGFKDYEIASQLKINANTVSKAKSRRRARLLSRFRKHIKTVFGFGFQL